jgi:hypothetical protein
VCRIPKKPQLTRKDFDAFVKEIYIMKSICHPSVCLLMGACYVENKEINNDPSAYGTVYIGWSLQVWVWGCCWLRCV